MRYRLVTTIDDGASALTCIQNEIGNLKVSPKPTEDMKIEALLASLGPEYESTVTGIDVRDTTKYEDVVVKIRNARNSSQSRRRPTKKTLGRKVLIRRVAMAAKTRVGTATRPLSHTAAPANHKPEQTRGTSPERGRCHTRCKKVTAGTGGTRTDPWCLDSAATSHMTNCRDMYTCMRKIRDTVTVADGRQLLSQGFGRIRVHFEENALIDDVLYVSDLQANLLSIGQLAERGITCLFGSEGAYLRRDGEILAYARRAGRNYVLYLQDAHEALMTAGQDNGQGNGQGNGQDDGQDAGKNRGWDAGQNVIS